MSRGGNPSTGRAVLPRGESGNFPLAHKPTSGYDASRRSFAVKEFIRTADSKGRVAFPGFANATLIIEQVDETEFRVRKARVIPEKDLKFHEEDFPLKLSERDAAKVVKALKDPPAPNRAARRAARRFRKDHG
jgi:uncharacterized protein (DUF1778 family)